MVKPDHALKARIEQWLREQRQRKMDKAMAEDGDSAETAEASGGQSLPTEPDLD